LSNRYTNTLVEGAKSIGLKVNQGKTKVMEHGTTSQWERKLGFK